MKTESKTARKQGIADEIIFFTYLQGTALFPGFVEHGETAEMHYFIMELLGPTVSMVRRALPDQRYTRLTCAVLAREMLECIEELHLRGFVHRDIKPGNFLFRYDSAHIMCLIDFGLARQFVDPQTGQQYPPRDTPGFTGTCSFASVNAHAGQELNRRDDIISWLYTVIEITERGLPWPGSKNREATYQLKQTTTPVQLCRSLPSQFIEIFDRTLVLGFYDCPDYRRFYELLDAAIEEAGSSDSPFDWELLDPVAIPIAVNLPHRSNIVQPERRGAATNSAADPLEGGAVRPPSSSPPKKRRRKKPVPAGEAIPDAQTAPVSPEASPEPPQNPPEPQEITPEPQDIPPEPQEIPPESPQTPPVSSQISKRKKRREVVPQEDEPVCHACSVA
jgi:serine/threonine protein kinase